MMKLVNNLEIPDIGLGVYKISEKEMNEVISLAYQDGYKLFERTVEGRVFYYGRKTKYFAKYGKGKSADERRRVLYTISTG